jgi:hypothetical protein
VEWFAVKKVVTTKVGVCVEYVLKDIFCVYYVTIVLIKVVQSS